MKFSTSNTRVHPANVLVLIYPETRGLENTLSSLKRGFGHVRHQLAFLGSGFENLEEKQKRAFTYVWHLEDPPDWNASFLERLGQETYGLFLGTESAFRRDNPNGYQLWLSGLIGLRAKLAALDYFVSLELWKKFSHFALVRSDFYWYRALSPNIFSGDSSIVLLDGEHHGGQNDRFLLAKSSLARHVRELFRVERFAALTARRDLERYMSKLANPNPEKLFRYGLERSFVGKKVFLIDYPGYLVRGSSESSRWSMGYWKTGQGVFVKYPSEIVLTKIGGIFGRGRPRELSAGKSFAARLLELADRHSWLKTALLLAVGEREISREFHRGSK